MLNGWNRRGRAFRMKVVMWRILKNMWPGLALIGLASGVLLVSDLDRRQNAGRERNLPRLAILQWTSTDLLDRTVEGMVEGLRHQGFEQGRTASIRFFNAAGDTATANLMAREATGGSFDLVLTASTLALQAVAAANRDGTVPHVFAGVTDPYGAGVGITGSGRDEHPPHLTGVGTFQPVDAAIRMARQMNPGLKRLGVVWNPSEDNSEACVRMARATCGELGVELIEAQAGNTSEVAEAVRSVLARKAEAVWIGGDTVAMAAIHTILSTAADAGIPVFSNDPTDAARGALFGLGASYRQVGFEAGDRAGQILRGASPASFAVDDFAPEVLTLNDSPAGRWPAWTIRDDHYARARTDKPAVAAGPVGPEPGRIYSAGVLSFGPNPIFEMAAVGIREALEQAGFVAGGNLVLHEMHANNDISMLPQVVQRMVQRRPDLLIPLSTPCLAAVLAGTGDLPVVFGVVTSPIEAGAGDSFERHLPQVTGAVWTAPAPESVEWIRRLFPKATRLGVLYNPAHANSLAEVEAIRELCRPHGLTLIERSLNTSGEVKEAMTSLLQADPDIVFGMGDNTVVTSFAAVADACLKAGVPLVADDASLMGSGALFSVGAGPRLEGRHAGQLAARVLLGENPADIPFMPSVELETAVDLEAARKLNLALPVDFLKAADLFFHLHARRERPARVALVNLVQTRVLEQGEEGVRQGLVDSGLKEGVDFTLRPYNAQGEIAQLPALLDAALQQDPDLLVTVTTPAMIAALNRVKDVPVVFTVSSDPVALGIVKADAIPAHVTGVHDDPPVDRLLEMAMQYIPGLASVSIVYDPAQPNAVLSVEKLRRVCREQGIRLHEATAFSVTDLPAAVQSVVQRKAGALVLSADNLVLAGFPAILGAARAAGLPIFTTDPDLVEQGATGAIGDDYHAWGVQAGRLAAKVLAGVPPGVLPMETTRNQKVLAPKARERRREPHEN